MEYPVLFCSLFSLEAVFLSDVVGKMGPSEEHVMPDNVIELTDAALDKAIHASDVPVLVYFWAPWCGACNVIAPIIREIAGQYAQKAKIGSLNTEQARDSAVEFGISRLPTIILFSDGRVRKKWVGLTSKKDLCDAIDQLL